uniref:Uncharacterized protein n=1 Tax=Arundo donax TaxID=35708 RepID=A0A0A9BZP3_ARUDO
MVFIHGKQMNTARCIGSK